MTVSPRGFGEKEAGLLFISTLAHNGLIVYALEKALGVIGAMKKATVTEWRCFIELSESEEARPRAPADLAATTHSDKA